MNDIEAANKNSIQIEKELEILGTRVFQIMKQEIITEKDRVNADVLLDKLDECERNLRNIKEEILQKFYKTHDKQVIDR